MLQRFEETGHPIFTCVSALSRGILKRMKNKDTIHFTAETSNIELLFRNIHFASQLSINGAVPSWSGRPGPNETEPVSEKIVTSEESVNTETLKSVNSQAIKLFGGFCQVETRFWVVCFTKLLGSFFFDSVCLIVTSRPP